MRGIALLVTLLLVPLIAASTEAATLTYRDRKVLEGNDVRGLSGMTHAVDSLYYAVNDHPALAVAIAVQTRDDATFERVAVVKAFALPGSRDAEGIAAASSRIYVIDEATSTMRAYEAPLTQQRSQPVPVPEIFQSIVPNQGLESLCFSRDGASAWIANERALTMDGNPATPATPRFAVTRVRLQRYDVNPERGIARPAEQYEYETSGVHDWGGQVGLCDLAALPDGRLLALERSAAQNLSGVASIRTRIFLIDTTGATDIGKPPYDKGLAAQPPPPAPIKVKKTLLWDGFVHDENGENVEGLCLGEKLGDGRWAVLGVVDSGDGGLVVSTPAIVSFELKLAPPAPVGATPASSASAPKPAAGDAGVAPTKVQ